MYYGASVNCNCADNTFSQKSNLYVNRKYHFHFKFSYNYYKLSHKE